MLEWPFVSMWTVYLLLVAALFIGQCALGWTLEDGGVRLVPKQKVFHAASLILRAAVMIIVTVTGCLIPGKDLGTRTAGVVTLAYCAAHAAQLPLCRLRGIPRLRASVAGLLGLYICALHGRCAPCAEAVVSPPVRAVMWYALSSSAGDALASAFLAVRILRGTRGLVPRTLLGVTVVLCVAHFLLSGIGYLASMGRGGTQDGLHVAAGAALCAWVFVVADARQVVVLCKCLSENAGKGWDPADESGSDTEDSGPEVVDDHKTQ
jgi:hypothetical protein